MGVVGCAGRVCCRGCGLGARNLPFGEGMGMRWAVHPGADYSAVGVSAFADESSIASWAIDAVRYMSKEGIMKGVGAGKIDPLGNTTREQAILLIYRTYGANL